MPNGNDKWAPYEEKPQGDKWEQYAELATKPSVRMSPQPVTADHLAANAPRPDKGTLLHRTAETIRKGARGLTLGGFEGLGIPEATTGTGVVAGAAKQTGKGLVETGKEFLTDINAAPAKLLSNVLTGVGEAGKESWQGLRERDPEKFAHGFGSAVAQIVSLAAGAKGEAAPIGARARLAKVATGIEAGGEEAAHLKTAMSDIVKTAGQAGVNTIGELGKTVQKALDQHDATFNTAMAPLRKQPVDTSTVKQHILGLIKPDSSPAEVRYIKKAANEYTTPKTMDWLNARRQRLNASTSSIWKKSSGAASTTMRSDLDMAIDKTARNAVADLQYDVLDRANPGAGFRRLKTQQTSLWHLSDFLTDKVQGLEAKQLQHEGKGFTGRMRPSVYASKTGPHGYISHLGEAFSEGPLKEANRRVKEGLGRKGVSAGRIAAMTLPVAHLLSDRRTTPFDLTPPPSREDDNE